MEIDIRPLTEEERKAGILPALGNTIESKIKRKIAEAEDKYLLKQKKPFNRSMVWQDWERANKEAEIQMKISGNRKDPEIPNVDDEKYRRGFIFIGEKKNEMQIIGEGGIKKKVPNGVIRTYKHEINGHKCNIFLEQSDLEEEKPKKEIK